jgi:hypothetical protein
VPDVADEEVRATALVTQQEQERPIDDEFDRRRR